MFKDTPPLITADSGTQGSEMNQALSFVFKWKVFQLLPTMDPDLPDEQKVNPDLPFWWLSVDKLDALYQHDEAWEAFLQELSIQLERVVNSSTYNYEEVVKLWEIYSKWNKLWFTNPNVTGKSYIPADYKERLSPVVWKIFLDHVNSLLNKIESEFRTTWKSYKSLQINYWFDKWESLWFDMSQLKGRFEEIIKNNIVGYTRTYVASWLWVDIFANRENESEIWRLISSDSQIDPRFQRVIIAGAYLKEYLRLKAICYSQWIDTRDFDSEVEFHLEDTRDLFINFPGDIPPDSLF